MHRSLRLQRDFAPVSFFPVYPLSFSTFSFFPSFLLSSSSGREVEAANATPERSLTWRQQVQPHFHHGHVDPDEALFVLLVRQNFCQGKRGLTSGREE